VDPAPIRSRLDQAAGIPGLVEALGGECDEPPRAPPIAAVDRPALRKEPRSQRLAGISMFDRRGRRQAREAADRDAEEQAQAEQALRQAAHEAEQRRLDGLFASLQELRSAVGAQVAEEVEVESLRRSAEQEGEQAELDQVWELLNRTDPATVVSALERAFADNDAPARPVECRGRSVSVAMVFGHPDRVPEQTPALTPAGRPTLRKRTKSDRNLLYLTSLASNVLATVKETFAVAPGLDEVSVLAVRQESARSKAPMLLGGIYAGVFSRAQVERVDWASANPTDAILHVPGAMINLRGQASEVTALDLSDHADLQTTLESIASQLGFTPIPARTSRRTRSRHKDPVAPESCEIDEEEFSGAEVPAQSGKSVQPDGRRQAPYRIQKRRYRCALRSLQRVGESAAAGVLPDLPRGDARQR
jgi:hypothetical protein